MTAVIVLNMPGEFDYRAFADSTRRTLELLEPLTRLQSSEFDLVNRIATQTFHYTRTIAGGIRAAQTGFNVADDMISFAEFMSDSTAEDRQQYLVGVMEMAEQACTRSDEILCTFRQVRQELFRLVEEARDEMDNSVNAFNHDDLHLVDTLRAAIDALEAFSSEISAFVQWWDWLKIESNSWRTGTRTVLFNLESLREPAVIEQWHVVRYQFTEYTNMVRLMEDTFPHLFSPPTHWQGDNAVGHQEEINITRPELTSILGGAVAFEEASIRELPGSPGPPSIAQTLASFLPSSEPRIPGAFLEGYENLLSNWYITLPVVCALLYLVSHAPLHP